MNVNMRKWIVGGFLLGAMAFAGAPNAQAQFRQNDDRNRRDTYDNRDGRDNRNYRFGRQGNFRDFQREIRFLEERIRREKDDLRLISRRFGKNSFQARDAKQRLKQDERHLKELKKEWKRFQKDSKRRDDRGPYRY